MAWRLARVLDRLVTRVEHSSALDPLADVVARAGVLVRARPVRDLLSGTPAAHPAHPAMVAVPLGSWVTASVLDAVGDQESAAQLATGFGVLAAVPTAAAGFSDWLDTAGAERRVGLVHALVNDVALGLYAASWFARRGDRHRRGALLAGAGAAVASVGGWLGGHLAYAQGVGVDTTVFQRAAAEWVDVLGEDELPADGEMKQVDADGVSLVVIGSAAGPTVLADRCTHRGGPLSDGELRDGCVVCPWHGSMFEVSDGAVRHGPATRPQPQYEVRVSAGRVEVRRASEPRTMRTNPVGR